MQQGKSLGHSSWRMQWVLQTSYGMPASEETGGRKSHGCTETCLERACGPVVYVETCLCILLSSRICSGRCVLGDAEIGVLTGHATMQARCNLMGTVAIHRAGSGSQHHHYCSNRLKSVIENLQLLTLLLLLSSVMESLFWLSTPVGSM